MAANRCWRPYLLPPPRSPIRATPFPAHVVSALGSFRVQVPCVATFSTRGGGLFSPCSSRTRLPAPRFLRSCRNPRTVLGAQSAPPSTLSTSRPIPVVASGREMVVLSVPAEVTVILLDIEGTTTPIAFVKVRGGRERGNYLCLKTKIFVFTLSPETRGVGEVVWLCIRSGMRGRRKAAAVYEDAFPRGTIFLLLHPCPWLDADGWEGVEVVVKKGRRGGMVRRDSVRRSRHSSPRWCWSDLARWRRRRRLQSRSLRLLVLQNGKTEMSS